MSDQELRQARVVLLDLLDPQGPDEERVATWLMGWDLSTIGALVAMLARNR